MATDLVELTADIVIAHASVTEMSSDDLLKEIQMVYATLQALEKGEKPVAIEAPVQEPKKRGRKPNALVEPIAEPVEAQPVAPPIPAAPALTISEAFKPDQVGCMICGKTGMKFLKRHLTTAHDIKPGKYRKQFNVPKDQPLAATAYVEQRRQAALDRGLGVKLVLARAARKAKQTEEQKTT